MTTSGFPTPNMLNTLSSTLRAHPEHAAALQSRGLRDGHLKQIKDRTISESIVALFAVNIEQVTGLDLRQLSLDQARYELWHNKDPLPDIGTTTQLIREFATALRAVGIRKTSRLLATERRTLLKWTTAEARPRVESYKSMLEFIVAYRTGRLQEKKNSDTSVTVPSSADANRKEFLATLSAMHALTTIIEQQTARTLQIFDGDRSRIAEMIRRLARAVHLTPAALKRLADKQPLTPEDTKILERVINPRRKS